MNKNLLSFLINLAIGLVITLVIFAIDGLFSAETTPDIVRILSDGFFASGLLFLSMGGLTWASNGGAVDALGYGVKNLIGRMFSRDYEQKRQSYYEYQQERRAKAKSPKDNLLTGLLFLAISVVLLLVYNQMV